MVDDGDIISSQSEIIAHLTPPQGITTAHRDTPVKSPTQQSASTTSLAFHNSSNFNSRYRIVPALCSS